MALIRLEAGKAGLEHRPPAGWRSGPEPLRLRRKPLSRRPGRQTSPFPQAAGRGTSGMAPKPLWSGSIAFAPSDANVTPYAALAVARGPVLLPSPRALALPGTATSA